jgi:hypothetical protein
MDVAVEAAVLAAARKMFKKRRDIGAEYIEAPLADLMAMVVKIVTPFLAVVGTPMDAESETTKSSEEDIDDDDESKDEVEAGVPQTTQSDQTIQDSVNKMAPVRARSFTFQVDNFTRADCDHIIRVSQENTTTKYMVVGKDVSESGAPRLNGYVTFKNPCTLTLFPRAEIQIAYGSIKANIDDCTKGGDILVSVGRIPTPGKRNDIVQNDDNPASQAHSVIVSSIIEPRTLQAVAQTRQEHKGCWVGRQPLPYVVVPTHEGEHPFALDTSHDQAPIEVTTRNCKFFHELDAQSSSSDTFITFYSGNFDTMHVRACVTW